jgi:hypothetical protein
MVSAQADNKHIKMTIVSPGAESATIGQPNVAQPQLKVK